MTRTIHIAGLLLVFAMSSVACQTTASAIGQQEKPNILFIFADDFAYDCIAATGNTQIKTPNLDELVQRGTTFTHAYNMGSYSGAVCIASRMMLLSGRSVWTAQRLHQNAETERAAGRWWPQYMKAAGYETYMTGKWHLRASAQKSFDHVKHVRPGMPNQTDAGYLRPAADGSDPWSPSDPAFGGYWKGGKHWSQIVADDGVEYIAHAAARDKPFFMYLAFNAPHDPRQAPKEYLDMYPPDSIDIPQPFKEQYDYMELSGTKKKLRDERLAPWPRTAHAMQVHRSEYYAIITHLDAQIGRILDALKTSGKADSTWIVFTADHGLAVGHHGLLGKQNMYDHSVRVPFIVVGPGVGRNKRSDAPIYLQDVMPTALELAGVEKPEHVYFESILPLLKHSKAPRRDAIYGGYLKEQRAVTLDGYKLIVYPPFAAVRLYHLDEDPDERHDIAGDPQSKPIIRKLFARLRQLQTEVDDDLDLAEAFPQL